MPFVLLRIRTMKVFTLMKWASGANSAIHLIILQLGLPSHKKEEEVVKRAYEVMEFCAQVSRN